MNDLQLTRRAEYAIRAMVDLAANYDDQPVMSRKIASRQDIPLKFLIQIIPDLRSAGLIHTVRGSGGGIFMSKKPTEINIRQIVEAIEGPISLNQCLTGEKGCSRKSHCSIHGMWRLAQDRMVSVLESTTLSELTASKGIRKEEIPPVLVPIDNETEIEV